MFTKLAAKWMDMFSCLSPSARSRIMASGIVKSEEDYVRGINLGTDNIFKRLGYTQADIARITNFDRNMAIVRVKQELASAQKSGDRLAIKRNQEVLDALQRASGLPNPGSSNARSQGENPRSTVRAGIRPALKIVHSRNADQFSSRLRT